MRRSVQILAYILGGVFFSMSCANAQQNPFGALMQGMMEQAIIQGAIDEWRKLPSGLAQCVNNSLRRQGWTAVALGQRGIGPNDARVANIVEPCRVQFENEQAVIEQQQEEERQKADEEKRQKADEAKQKKLAEEQRVNDLKAISLKVNYECSIKDNGNEYKSYCDDAIRLSSNNKDITIEKAIKDIPVKPKPPNQRVLQPRFKQKKEHHTFYPATAEDKTKHLTIGFVLGDQKNQDHLLDALFLKGYLAGHDGSPLQRAIMGENLASSVDVLIDLEVLEPYIYFIFKDVLDPQKLIATFDKTLEQISLKGFDEGAKNASLHQLKIAFLNTAEMGYPTGLVLFFKGVLPYFNGGDPLELFCFKKRLEKLEKRVADPLYLKKAIKETFLDNPHRAEVYFTNKPHLLEEELPAPIVIDAETKKRIAEETQLIDSKQSKPQDSSCLPILQIEQLPPRPPTYSLEKKGGEIPIFVHNSWTNGLSYFHLMIDLPDLDENASHYLGLMVHFLGAIGTRKRDFHQLIEKKESFLSQFSLRIDGTQKNLVLYVEGESLSENLKEGFLIIKEILEETVFSEKERLQEIMKDLFNTLKARFTQRSYGRCILHGKSHLRTAYQAIENSKGFSFFNWLKKEMTQPIDATIKELETLYQRLLKGDGLLEMSLCTDLKEIPPFSLNAPRSEPAFINSNKETKNKPQFFGFCVPIQASENAFVFNGFRFDDAETPIARVVVQLIKHLQLHPILREKHGAYGASISIDPEQGLFAMYTTCDPNIDLTYQIFQEVFNPIIAGEFSEEDLYEAKLAALQVTEEISLLNMRAHDQYWRNRLGRTESKRLDDRNRLIKADRSAIRECTAKILGNLTGGISVTLSARKAFENLQHHPSTLVEL